MPISTQSAALDGGKSRLGRIAAQWPSLAAAALGIVIVYVVGFAGAHSIHEAAHDARHSINFPCH